MQQMQSGDAVIIFPPPLQAKAERLRGILPELKRELEEKLQLQWHTDLKPAVFLMEDQKKFEKLTGNPYISAFAVPAKQIIVMDCSRVNIRPLTLETTLKHELGHLLLHYHIPDIPKWLDEGICQWASDGISELMTDKQGDLLRSAHISGNLLRLQDLESRFPHSRNGLLLAYEQSKSFTEYIVREFGAKALINILAYLKRGEGVDRAVEKSLHFSLKETEERWHEHLRESGTWLIWFSVHIYEILFFLTALATVFGFVRLMIRKKNYPDTEEDWDGEGDDAGIIWKEERNDENQKF